MSYQALYRAWRPRTFSEIYGQDAIVRTLKRQVAAGRIGHAYLFTGTRGTGKTTAARVLSRAINCLNPRDGDPCGECEICKALEQETSMDVLEIDAASNSGVDKIRDLREMVKYPPSLTKYKVYIIDEVHMLSRDAFNALLKTLEEPPAHAVFILATTEPQMLLATILSRCQRFDFHRISSDVIVERMMVVLGGIGRSATEDALYEIARASEGAMRDALSLLDVCLSYTDGEVTAQLAREVLGTAGRAVEFDFTDALIEQDAGRALVVIDEVMRRGSDPQVFIRDTVSHLRGILLAGAVGDSLEAILEVTREDAERFREQAKRVHPDALNRMLELFMRADPDTKWAANPRTILELAAVRACRPDREADASVAERLDRVEKLLEKGVPAQAAPGRRESAPKSAPAKKPQPPAAKPPPAEEPPAAWHDALEKLKAENPSIRAPLDSMRFIRFDGSAVTVEFSRKQMMHMKVLERKQAQLNEALTEAFGAPVALNMTLEGGGAAEKKLTATARDVINQSYDVFGRDKIELVD